MHRPVVTLLTDYGVGSLYVGILHGVIVRICPEAQVVDLQHTVAGGDVVAGAVALADALAFLPVGVHLAVVDPGVGTDRRAIAVRTVDGRHFVGPDNGLLAPALAATGGISAAVEISRSRFRRAAVSATFHGRDLFAPVAAALAAGAPLEATGEPTDPGDLVGLTLPDPQPVSATGSLGPGWRVEVVTVDPFGNLGLWIDNDAEPVRALLPGRAVTVRSAAHTTAATFAHTFADVAAGELLLHPDSTGRLALAVNRGSAAASLQLGTGDPVWLHP